MSARPRCRRAAFEVPGIRVSLTYTPGVPVEKRPVARSHKDVAPLLARFIGDAMDREHVVAALVDARQRVIGVTLIALGHGTGVQVRLADVYRPLILGCAVSYYLAHSHPSGDPEASAPDLDLTRRLHELGLRLGIELADHLIIGANGAYRSLREHGQGVAAWREEARERARTADPELVRRIARLSSARSRRPPRPSLTRADSLRAALWECVKCRRRQTQKKPRCRYCGAPQVVH